MNRPRKPRPDLVSEPSGDLTALPAPIVGNGNKILAALEKNDVEALRVPIDWNEVRPLFARSGAFRAGTDPIEILKALSFDRGGKETLAVARAVLAQSYVKITRGPVTLYEWPAFARRPSPPLDEAAARARWQCVRFNDLARANADGKTVPHAHRRRVGRRVALLLERRLDLAFLLMRLGVRARLLLRAESSAASSVSSACSASFAAASTFPLATNFRCASLYCFAAVRLPSPSFRGAVLSSGSVSLDAASFGANSFGAASLGSVIAFSFRERRN